MSVKQLIVTATLTATALLGSTVAHAQCASDSECKGGRVCSEGVCTEATAACGTDVDCPGDLICASGTCSQPTGAAAAPPATPTPAPVSHAPASHGYAGAGPAPVPAGAAPYGPPQDQVRYETETKGITGLIIAGPIVFGVAYATGIAVTAGLDADEELIAYSAIPVAGPWVMLADSRTSDYSGALAANGLLQAGGLAMFIIGVSVRREHQVPVYASEDGHVQVGLSAVPGGLLANGHF
jgi:hypothetical protein